MTKLSSKTFCIFIDESGWADLKSIKQSPYFTLCGVVVNEQNRQKFAQEWNQLKQTHFGSSDYIMHKVNLRKILTANKNMDAFLKDLELFFLHNHFFLLFVVVEKQKAINFSWQNKTVYERSYRFIIGNLIKFLIAKNSIGKIHAEASNVQQDIFLYSSFFHYIANGIPHLNISPQDVKQHLTSVAFVTKLNNDPEEQLADLFGTLGKIYAEIKNKKNERSKLDKLDKLLYKVMESNLFGKGVPKLSRKIVLYKDIDSFGILP